MTENRVCSLKDTSIYSVILWRKRLYKLLQRDVRVVSVEFVVSNIQRSDHSTEQGSQVLR